MSGWLSLPFLGVIFMICAYYLEEYKISDIFAIIGGFCIAIGVVMGIISIIESGLY